MKKRRWLRVLWCVPIGLALFIGFLWLRAGRDFAYMVRVLWHGDSGTSDFRWKRADPVAASPTPVRWREAPDCGAVRHGFAGAGVPDLDAYLGEGGALGLVVIHDGAIACEWYGNGGAREQPAAAFSISKTITSLVLARAVAEHRIAGLDQPITATVPELRARDPRFAQITLADLVDMRSGIGFREDTVFPWVDQDAPAVYYASDLATTVIDRPQIESAPGTFLYNDYAPNLAGLAIARAYGAPLASGPMQSLWNELGAELPAAWSIDDHGFAWHESGFVVTARDLARIGQLILDHGKVGDRQVAPDAWVERSTTPAGRVPVVDFAGVSLGYRNGWWVLGDHTLVAMGKHGQVMVVSLATRTVIVRLGEDGHDETNASIAHRLGQVADQL